MSEQINPPIEPMEPTLNRSPIIVLVKGKMGSCHLRVAGRNGRVIFSSETYFNKSNARRAGEKFHQETGFPFIDRTKKLELA